jgi:hypothetical protein
VSGTSSISSDTLVLHGSSMPDGTALYFQGTVKTNGGNGVAFGDGLRCVSGTSVRLGVQTNLLGVSDYPAPGDLPVSVKGNVAPGLLYYQVWYRNAAVFCNPETYNLTNAFQIVWTP